MLLSYYDKGRAAAAQPYLMDARLRDLFPISQIGTWALLGQTEANGHALSVGRGGGGLGEPLTAWAVTDTRGPSYSLDPRTHTLVLDRSRLVES